MRKDYGKNVLSQVEPSPIIKKIGLFSFVIVATLFAMLFLPWVQTIKGVGQVVSFDPTQRPYSVLAPVEGFVEEFYIKENQLVHKGDKLFKMRDLDQNYLEKLQKNQRDLEVQVENTQGEIKNLEIQIEQNQEYLKNGLEVFEHKSMQIQQKVKSLSLKQLALEKNYEVFKKDFQRVEALHKEGIESKRVFESAHNRYIKAKTDFENVALEIEIEKTSFTINIKEKRKFNNQTKSKIEAIRNTLLQTNSKLQALEQKFQLDSIAIERYKNSVVVAPKDGYVVRIVKNDQNRYLKKGEEVLYFSPLVSQKAILLKVTDFNMPLVKENLTTRIMFHGWPALQISGWPKIQFGSFGGVVSKVEHISHEQGFYYAYVTEDSKEPWPKGDELRIGTQANIWVKLSSVPIWYQLWRLMNALPPKMVHPDKEKY